MPKADSTVTTRRRANHTPGARITLPAMPPPPPKTEKELADEKYITDTLNELVRITKARNLDNAVALAELARQGKLPVDLQEHFCELGRRYSELLRRPRAAGPVLRVLDGGAA